MKNFNLETSLFIPSEILNHPLLNNSEQFVLSCILKYSKNGICHKRKNELAKYLGKNYGSFRVILSNLRKKDFVRDIDNGLSVFINNKHFILDEDIYGKQ